MYMTLGPTMNRVLEVRSHFDSISLNHVSRVFNNKSYSLFKEDLSLQEGTLCIQEFMEDATSSNKLDFLDKKYEA